MLHETWKERTPIKKVEVINTDAKKFTVSDMLTVGKQYDVINETEEYYQIIDNSGLVGGYYKHISKKFKRIIIEMKPNMRFSISKFGKI